MRTNSQYKRTFNRRNNNNQCVENCSFRFWIDTILIINCQSLENQLNVFYICHSKRTFMSC